MRLGNANSVWRSRCGWNLMRIANCELWWETGVLTERLQPGLDITAGTPDVFTAIPNIGGYGGTFGSAGAARPPVARLECGGATKRVAAFDGTADIHTSSHAAATWAASHQVWTWEVELRPAGSGFVFSTATGAAGSRGVALEYDAANERVIVTVSNGTALCVNVTTANDSVPLGEVSVIVISYSDAAGYDVRIDGASVASGALANATDSGDPAATLQIGCDSAGANFFAGQVMLLLGYSRVLVAEILRLEAYASKYQGQSELTKLAPTLFYDPSVTGSFVIDHGNAEAGDQLEEIYDIGGNAHESVQATDAKQGTATTLDGNVAVEVDGVADCYAVGGGIGWPAGTSHTHIQVCNPDVTAGSRAVFDAQSGRLLMYAARNGAISVFDGAYRDIAAAAATGDQVLELHYTAGGNLEAYRQGVYLGAVAVGAGVSLGGNAGLFSQYGLASNFFDGKSALAWHRDSLLTGVDLYRARAEIAGRFSTVWPWSPLVVPDASGWWDVSDATTITSVGSGLDVVVDGGFTNGANWTDSGAGTWSIMGGEAVAMWATNLQYLDAAVAPLTIGLRYEITYTITGVINGQARVLAGTTAGTYRNAPGTYTETLLCAGSGALRFEGAAAALDFFGTIDNVSAVELTRVTDLADKSGRARHAIEVAASGPTLDATGWNGMPSMVYSNDYLTADGVAADLTGADKAFTLFMLIEWMSIGGNDYVVSLGNSANNVPFQVLHSNAATPRKWTARKDDNAAASVVNASDASVATAKKLITWQHTGTAESIWVNQAATSVAGTASNVGAMTIDQLTFGALRRIAVSNYAAIRQAETVVYKRAISTAERVAVSDYLIAKWGVD